MRTAGRVALCVIVILVLIGLPAAAQDDGTLDVDVRMGLGGFVSNEGANPISVTISAETLISGSARITFDGAVLAVPVEVPAGSVKTYEFELPAVVGNGAARVQIVDDSDVIRWSERFSVRVPRDELSVGVFGGDGVVEAIDGQTSVPFALDLVAFPVEAADLTRSLAPLDYLVLVDPPDRTAADAILDWARLGGRVLVTTDAAAEIGWGALFAPGETTALDRGEITLTPSGGGSDILPLIRSLPPQTVGTQQGIPFEERASQLFEAASFGSARSTATLGWLVGALVAYVVVAGPVNFFILARLRKRDWAWATIPAIGLLAMGAFWIVGRQSAPGEQVHHASVFIQRDRAVRIESGVMLVAGTEGEHVLSFGTGALARPFDAGRWWGVGSSTQTEIRLADDGGVDIAYELASYGIAAAQTSWSDQPVDIEITVEGDDVAVVNNSALEFEDWGVRLDDRVFVSSVPFAAATTSLSDGRWSVMNAFEGSTIADAILQQGPWSEERQQRIWPLSFAATSLDRELLSGGDFFFGFTDDLDVPVTTDGRVTSASGATLVVVEIPASINAAASSAATPELISAVNADWIEQYGPTFVFGADEIGLRFTVPPTSAGPLRMDSGVFGQIRGLDALQVYNWETGVFDVIELGVDFEPGGRVSAGGEVMVNLVFGGFESELMIQNLTLTWGNSS